MDAISELQDLINSKGRRVYVVEKLVDLRRTDTANTLYILQLPDGSTAAGGRGGGFGERRIVKVYRYEFVDGSCKNAGEIEDDEKLDQLDLPYHATAMPIIDLDGQEKLISGVIDPEMVQSYRQILG